MIENEIYCYVHGFLKWKISEKTTYIVENKKLTRKICNFSFRDKRKIMYAKIIIRYYG